MRFIADEFEVDGLIGAVSGECAVDTFDDGLCLVSVDWFDAVFCRASDAAGKPVFLTDAEREDIESSLRMALAATDPVGHNGVVSLGGHLVG